MEAQCGRVSDKSTVKETSVGTVDYRSSAGRGIEEKSVHVIHQDCDGNAEKHGQTTSGQMLTNAAEAVTSTLQSAKEVLSNSNK